MNRFVALKCRRCKAEFPVNTQARCARCGGILASEYDLRGLSFEKNSRTMWDFRELLPPVERIVSMGEGWTPCLRLENLEKILGLESVYAKMESLNPTGSFKDRAASLGVSFALSLSKKGCFTASSGNAALATCAYSSKAGLRCALLIRDDVPKQKLKPLFMYSPLVFRVKNLYQTQKRLLESLSLVSRMLPDWFNLFLWAPVNPALVDAYKTISFEIFLQIGIPDYVVVPVAGGDLLFGVHKGFLELKHAGLTHKLPKMVAVQPLGSDPLVQSFDNRLRVVESIVPRKSVAVALQVGFGAEHALDALYESKGFGVSVTDKETIEAHRLLAKKEGVFCEISSATAIAALFRAKIKNEKVCVIITSTGFKHFLPSDAKEFFVEDVNSLIQNLRKL